MSNFYMSTPSRYTIFNYHKNTKNKRFKQINILNLTLFLLEALEITKITTVCKVSLTVVRYNMLQQFLWKI